MNTFFHSIPIGFDSEEESTILSGIHSDEMTSKQENSDGR